MIDVSPLLIASENSQDPQEKEVLRFLAEQAAEDRPYPRRVYERGDAADCLSPDGFAAFEKVMKSVFEERKRIEADSKGSNKTESSMTTAAKLSGSKRPRSAIVGHTFSTRKTRRVGAKLVEPSASIDEDKANESKDKSPAKF